jgi:uncharacterized protein (TIGR02284 family)
MQTRSTTSTARSNTSALHLLERLYRTCIDGERSFTDAAGDAETPEHRLVLIRYAEQRAAFADSIAEAIVRLGGIVDPTGTAAGKLHRAWSDIKRAATGREQPIFEECARGEDAAMRRFAAAMESATIRSLPFDVQKTIEQQREEIVATHDHMERLATSC